MKVLLVNTNLMKPPVAPIGLDYLADSLRAAGHEPALLDLCLADDPGAAMEAVGRHDHHLIGCSIRNTDDCYFADGGQAGFETRRGCPMECISCADPVARGRRCRLRPARQVVDEVRTLVGQGIDHLHTCDPEFNLPLSHAHEVCRAMIDAGLGEKVRWYAYCAPAPFDLPTAHLMRRAGCAGIDFGADSGSDLMLRRLGRHFGAADLDATASACRQAGIPFMYDLLLGGPGETSKTLKQSLDFVRRLAPDAAGISLGVRIYPGTQLADEVSRAGPLESNPALRGEVAGNPGFVRPVFYLSPGVGPDPAALVRREVGDDPRFFLPGVSEETRDYNSNDNEVLVRAIRDGARGAYGDILRRMRTG